ncbi:MAG: hypothetical protein OJF49_002042 [Ktedonobacterales bacterium]|jgi:2'-5' RNA ligase|nr:MAG: hypothetical protein OJF49_002042 [Ktedonobacterales bacterium]
MTTRVIATFPAFASAEEIERIRRAYDPLADSIPPHITLVFPFTSALSSDELLEHMRHAVAGIPPFPVHLQGVTGHMSEYLFLNVKRGNDELIALHDRLYTGILAPYLLPQFTYTPHLTVGRLASVAAFSAALQDAQSLTVRFEETIHEISLYAVEPDGRRAIEGHVAL